MNEPKIYQKASLSVEVVAGKKYAWCACGMSKKQPFCDGSHRGTDFSPVVFTAESTEIVAVCGCKHTSTPPFCDGSHKKL